MSGAFGLNYDGTKGTGLQWFAGCTAHAYRWTKNGATVDLGSSGLNSRGTAISGDGTTIVGFDEDPATYARRAAIWTEGNAEPELILPEGDQGECYAVTFDGSKACGGWNGYAMYWDKVVGPINIGTLPGDEGWGSFAMDIADNGTIVGYSGNPFFSSSRGFVWTPADGMMLFTEFLDVERRGLPRGPEHLPRRERVGRRSHVHRRLGQRDGLRGAVRVLPGRAGVHRASDRRSRRGQRRHSWPSGPRWAEPIPTRSIP